VNRHARAPVSCSDVRRLLLLPPLGHALIVGSYLAARAFTPRGRLGDALALVDEFAPWLFLPLPLWLVVAALTRGRAALAAAALPWLLFAALYGALFVPRRAHLIGPSPGVDVRLVTFNLGWTRGDPVAIARLIASTDADVVLLQELTAPAAERIEALLADRYPHRRLHPSERFAQGRGLLSRHPIVDEVSQAVAPGATRLQRAELRVDGRLLHVVNFHPSPPEPRWLGAPPLPRGLGRDQQASQVADALREIAPRLARGEPVVLAGDLNMGDRGPLYGRLLAAGLTDAHRAAGWGLGLTFPAAPVVTFVGLPLPPTALLRIDHVLVSDRLRARALRVLPETAGSDHHPVVADLRLLD
jgi:vancomycin resistance protein VanJ